MSATATPHAAITAVRTPRQDVAPKGIPDALRAIWRDCCTAEPKSDVSRALIVNCIVVGDAARERELRESLDTLVARVPCRAFLVTLDDGNGAITAAVSGAARLHGSMRDLVLEQIELRAPRTAFDHLAGVVRPLLVNDLPTHVYWGTDWPADSRPFDLFSGMADHTVVDSARFVVPAAHLDALERRRARGRRITDLSWLRLRPWRRGMAEAFERFAWTPRVPTTATVRYGDQANAAAALYGHWLEQKLQAKVTLEQTDSHRGCPDLIELRHGANTVSLAFVEPGHVEVGVTTAESCYLPFTVPASRGTEASLLAAAIDMA